ncbi:succinate--CoA ligase subunit alpha [Leptothermofonsia sp. ETS-13]|uniref:succinate--CoA ligase subunit alpha n=1 Tax=Leptothermofonsia sp. ETS-13 TaxID=3035696 RepID=UPI003B9EDD6C
MNFRSDSRVLLQGIVEPLGAIYAPLMKAYGTNLVAGVSPGHGGQTLHRIPVFDLVETAVATVGAIDTSVIFVPPYAALDAALEAIAAGIHQIVLITDGIPPLDMVALLRQAEATETLVVGPNSPGIIVPGQILLGIHPVEFYTPGPVGLISRSGTLTYEIALELTQAGFGQSIGVSIGGDAIVGSSFPQWLQILDEDDNTEVIVLVGEIGGDSEEAAAHYIAEAIDKPVIAYVAGRTAPKGRRMGHAGAIIDSQIAELGTEIGTADSKINAFERAKIPVARRPSQIPDLVKKALKLPMKR